MSKNLSRKRKIDSSEEVEGSSRCAYHLCDSIDFLPFQCDSCLRMYCLEHSTYSNHECEFSASKDKVAIVCPLCRKTL